MNKKQCLVILHDGVEEMEAIAPIDILRRGDVEVTVASREFHLLVKGRNEIMLKAEVLLDEALKTDYDCIVVPGGPGVKKVRTDRRVLQALQKQHDDKRWVAAICAAPLVLKDAGILTGKQYTGHATIANELPELATAPVVVDGLIVTSQGAGTATAFALKLLECLTGETVANEVARSIQYPAP